MCHDRMNQGSKRARSAHGYELLGGGGVDGDARVKVSLCGAHLDSNRKPLQHLIEANTDAMEADNLPTDVMIYPQNACNAPSPLAGQ